MKLIHTSSLIILLFILSSSASAEKPDAGKTFKQLTTLLGTWKGKFPDGREHSVNYRLTAGGTVLVETWTLSTVRESMTLYHLDGEDLLATHYCPQGNQPRLVLATNGNRMNFEFRDGTNLKIADKSHQHSFWLRIIDANHFQRNEVYVQNGAASETGSSEDADQTVSYARVTDRKAQP
jgi:hypothetical protein